MFEVDLFGGAVTPQKQGGNLSENWEYPPFTVLNAREGWWQERKRQWLALGIKGEVGRGDNLLIDNEVVASEGLNFYREKARPEFGKTFGADLTRGTGSYEKSKFGKCLETGIGEKYGREEMNGTSIFDPVLCDLAYRWFCPPGGVVLDPFAGGSVRGIVASFLGHTYHGIDLREEQIMANIAQRDIAPYPTPHWYVGDSANVGVICDGIEADFIFTCPPYFDLEVYSEDPRDLSALTYPGFVAKYTEIIAASCELLKPDRFAFIVVGEIRDKAGNYRNFVGDTVAAFRAAGLHYYNEAILVTAVGSLPIRTGKQFTAGRKLGKTHQNILVFVKGDGKRAAQFCEVPV